VLLDQIKFARAKELHGHPVAKSCVENVTRSTGIQWWTCHLNLPTTEAVIESLEVTWSTLF
jgi:hypothetical protein